MHVGPQVLRGLSCPEPNVHKIVKTCKTLVIWTGFTWTLIVMSHIQMLFLCLCHLHWINRSTGVMTCAMQTHKIWFLCGISTKVEKKWRLFLLSGHWLSLVEKPANVKFCKHPLLTQRSHFVPHLPNNYVTQTCFKRQMMWDMASSLSHNSKIPLPIN